ncbi:MAG: S8 family serine peptidase [Flavisolibacter sp.]
MKLTRTVLAAAFLLISSLAFSQRNKPVELRSGQLQTETNIRQTFIDSFNKLAARYHSKAFGVLQFESIPGIETQKILAANGIQLIDYLPANAYTATIYGSLDLNALHMAKVRSLIQLSPQQKMEAHLATGELPSWAIKIPGTIDLWVSFPRSFNAEEVIDYLKKLNFNILSLKYKSYRILSIRIASFRLNELAGLPCIDYVQPIPQEDQPLNYLSRHIARANYLNAAVADGGKGLNGEGVVIGIGDNEDVQTHIDFTGRLIDRAPEYIQSPVGTGHGHHTHGTLGGAGNIMELYRGYASRATIVSQGYSAIISNASTYVNDYGMVVTNNSYGNSFGCGTIGAYDLSSRLLDQMAYDLPNLENVFAAGNAGTATCAPYPSGFKTVLNGFQSAKNELTVGATTDSGIIAYFSSRGPVKDGRIKPEIVAMGQQVTSTYPVNSYATEDGTSMSSPAVAGGLALIYQRYRQLNGGLNPKNGLAKALLCNGATDKGNAGPDYSYGFGWMNLYRSIEMLENNHYIIGSSTNGTTNNHSITVPANTAQLKVMLYWNDPAASVLSSQSLVNDLDLKVIDPSSTVYLPFVLDTVPANVNNTATTGADHINNVEQVVINNPAAGNYSLQVTGTAINQNPSQEYYLVFDPIPNQLKLTSPAGGEGVVNNAAMIFSWDAYGFTGTGTLDYSLDNGATWTIIQSGIDINRPKYVWQVPNVTSSQALLRITKDGTGESSTSSIFTIIGQPTVSLAATQCEGYININWTSVAGATDYEVMMLRGTEMQSIATTTGTNYTFSGLSKDSTYWVTVRARINGRPGMRAVAISRQPNNGTCSGSISDNDLKVDAILAPLSGRKFTSTQLSATSAVTIRIKNLDDAVANSFDVKYSINGGPWITETVNTPIAAGSTYTYTFVATADLSSSGIYNLTAVVKNNTADPVSANDTAFAVVKSLDNQPLDLTAFFTDDLESAQVGTYETAFTGLNGIERYDFSNSTSYGRVRSFINTGIAYSGSKALTLDMNRLVISGNTNYLTGTFNLVNYNATTNDIRLDFKFNNHGQVSDPGNRVWVRGDDSQPWIEAYDLDANENDPGIYKKSSSIELSRLLLANGQAFGTSFQVKWGQFGQLAATDLSNGAGYTFDDIRFYEAVNDMQMISIDSPAVSSCALSNNSVIKVTVRNSSNSILNNIPVRYKINNGSWVSEIIPSVAPNTTAPYSFSTTADLSAFGTYVIQTDIDYTGDNFRENDTTSVTVINTPVINTFPYLENFEAGNGYWYTRGKNTSWEYGTPNSTNINSAASGAKAWKTRLVGNYNDNELSYLYSPCFNINGLANPTLSFNVALDLEDCGSTLCDGAWVEYSSDGINWIKLGALGGGTNWYNKTVDSLWSIQGYTRWHVATIPLPTGINNLHIRFVLQSDPATNYEGIGIDDIHIYDNQYGIYSGATMSSPITQTISGNSWVPILNGGKLVASIQPNNQNLGVTNTQAYININSGNVRHTATQYYHDRNITIKPANRTLTDSVTVRFYFTDLETDSLIKATGCASCTKPSSVIGLGVSKYSDTDTSFENGSINDNNHGLWTFITPVNVIKVPFDKGYYAEFKVKDFSEFWLNNGGFGNNFPLPVNLIDFTAKKINNSDVEVKWIIVSEQNVSHYEIEVAIGSANAQFIKVGQVMASGNSGVQTYNYTDHTPGKNGIRYYRLKIVDADGSVIYSPVRMVQFDDVITWNVFPNPSNGLFNFVYQLENGESITIKVIDAKGSEIKKYSLSGNGGTQKLSIDLSQSKYASGVYLLQAGAKVFRIYKK